MRSDVTLFPYFTLSKIWDSMHKLEKIIKQYIFDIFCTLNQ